MKRRHQTLERMLTRWHAYLCLPRQSPPSWYRARLKEETGELREAKPGLHRLSETADVLFAISRARYDGFPVRKLPPFVIRRHSVAYAYMVAKYTIRWQFYRVAAAVTTRIGQGEKRSGDGAAVTAAASWTWKDVREVVNPAKDHKLDEVAARHGMDPERFRRVGRVLRRFWPLLP